MEIQKVYQLCGGKENWLKLYSLFSDSLVQFLNKSGLDHSENSFEILKMISEEVIDNFGETWYRQYLGK